MKIDLREFESTGGWYLRVNDETVAILMPSDLPEVCKLLASTRVAEVTQAVDKYYKTEKD